MLVTLFHLSVIGAISLVGVIAFWYWIFKDTPDE